MANTSRRNLLMAAATGGVAALGVALRRGELDAQEHVHKPIAGPMANATVTFGGWQTGPAEFDRFAALFLPSPPNPPNTPAPPNTPNNPNPIDRNHHQLTPFEVKVKAGGTVNFIIGGFHQVIIYDDGTQPGDINAAAQNPYFTLLIDDPAHRIFRGLNPQTVPQDRVETVHFAEPGDYLVICGVRPHFVNDGMYGFVRVIA